MRSRIWMLSVVASPAPMAVGVVWAAVIRQWWMLAAMYSSWLIMAAAFYPLVRDWERKQR